MRSESYVRHKPSPHHRPCRPRCPHRPRRPHCLRSTERVPVSRWQAFEWYSVRKERTSPIGHGTLLQCTLLRLYAEQLAKLGADGRDGDGDGVSDEDSVTSIARRTVSHILELAAYIVHTRCLSSSDDLKAVADQHRGHVAQQLTEPALTVDPGAPPSWPPSAAPTASALAWRTATYAEYVDVD